MRPTPASEASRSRFAPLRVSAVIGLLIAISLGASCPPRPWLFVANTANPIIQIFDLDASGGTNGLPKFVQQSGPGVSVAAAPLALQVVSSMLYVATGSGAVAQFAIDGSTGALTLNGSINAGSPPYSTAATASTLYVGNRGSGNVSVFSIDATTGSLASIQTATVAAVNVIQTDASGKFLFTGSRVNGAVAPQACTHTIQPNGTLAAAPQCVPLGGVPDSMVFSGGVLFILMNTLPAPGTGNTNLVSAFTVGATGALALRGQPLDVGAANSGSMGASIDGKFLFLPRQGQFLTIGTADPLGASGTTPVTNSPACVWPPAGAGEALADPRGGALYVSDPIGAATGNPQGARVTQLAISSTGALIPNICATVGGKPIAMAIFKP